MTPRPEPTPAELFVRWLDATGPDVPATRPYWTGDLAMQAGETRTDRRGVPHRFFAAVPAAAAVAEAAYAAHLAGRVLLTRRRLDDGRFEYLAHKRRQPEGPSR